MNEVKTGLVRRLMDGDSLAHKMMDAMATVLPPGDALLRELHDRLPELQREIEQLYDVHTEDDLRAALAFHESPAGKRFRAHQDRLVLDSMKLGQTWGERVATEFAARTSP